MHKESLALLQTEVSWLIDSPKPPLRCSLLQQVHT